MRFGEKWLRLAWMVLGVADMVVSVRCERDMSLIKWNLRVG